MLRITLTSSIAVFLLTAVPCRAAAPDDPVPLSSTASLPACFAAQAQTVPFSGIVLAARGDDVFVQMEGFSDLARTMPIGRETRFRLASVSKVMTAVAIGQLADQRRLSLDDPIGMHIAELPAEIGSITIDQLLHHRSGLGSYTSPQNFEAAMRARNARDLLPLIIVERPAFPPGEGQRYSNSGYALLGVIIENVTGRDYGDHLRAALFEPLGMTATGLDPEERMAAPITRIVGPGQPPADRPLVSENSLHPRGSPAGNGVSTVDDMLRLGRALLGDALLSPAAKARIFPPRNGAHVIGQSGGSTGVNTDFSVLPESGWVLVTLSNNDPPAGQIMGEVMRNAAFGRGCNTLTEADRPSPLMRERRPGQPGTGRRPEAPPS